VEGGDESVGSGEGGSEAVVSRAEGADEALVEASVPHPLIRRAARSPRRATENEGGRIGRTAIERVNE
jgi:hypothetical protein